MSYSFAHAAPGDWQLKYRNSDDTEFIDLGVRPAATSSYRLLGGIPSFSDNAAWYYWGKYFSISPTSTAADSGGGQYTINLDLGAFNPLDIGNLGDLLDAKVGTTTYANGIALLTSQINGISSSTTQVRSDWNQNSTSSFAYIQNKPLLSAVATSGAYADLTGKPTIPSAQIQSNWSQTSTTALDFIKNKPVATYSYPTRTIGTAFQVSTTSDASVHYSVRIANTLTLSGGAAGDIVLEIADDSGFTTNVHELGRVGNGNTGTLVVGLTLNDSIAVQVNGDVPAGKYARLRSVTSTGTPTYTYLSGEEKSL